MYDVAIIGGGPAGITAAIYCARFRLRTLLLSINLGGFVRNAVEIGNFPSYSKITGLDLIKKYKEHIENNEIDYKRETVTSIEKGFRITTNKNKYNAKYVIYALGTTKRNLGVPGEDLKGNYACATCDAPMMDGKDVVVVGGNDSGTTSALLLAEYANKVTVVEILDKLPTEPIWAEKIKTNPKIDVILSDSVKEIKGDVRVASVVLDSGKEIEAQGVFIEVGSDPTVGLAKKIGIKLDKWNCIEVNPDQSTSVPDFFAAGDVTNGSNYLRQIVAAQCEGAVAAASIYKKKVSENET